MDPFPMHLRDLLNRVKIEFKQASGFQGHISEILMGNENSLGFVGIPAVYFMTPDGQADLMLYLLPPTRRFTCEDVDRLQLVKKPQAWMSKIPESMRRVHERDWANRQRFVSGDDDDLMPLDARVRFRTVEQELTVPVQTTIFSGNHPAAKQDKVSSYMLLEFANGSTFRKVLS